MTYEKYLNTWRKFFVDSDFGSFWYWWNGEKRTQRVRRMTPEEFQRHLPKGA